MPIQNAYFFTLLGVFTSFVLPPLLRAAGVSGKVDPTANVGSFIPRVQVILTNRYVAVTLLSLVVSLIVVAVLEEQLDTWNMAFLSGLGWQSILARTFAPGT